MFKWRENRGCPLSREESGRNLLTVTAQVTTGIMVAWTYTDSANTLGFSVFLRLTETF